MAFARAEDISVRKIGQQARLSPTRVHQLTTDVDLSRLEQALGALQLLRLASTGGPRRQRR